MKRQFAIVIVVGVLCVMTVFVVLTLKLRRVWAVGDCTTFSLHHIFDKIMVIALPKRLKHMERFCKEMHIRPTFIQPVLKHNIDADTLQKLAPYRNANTGRLACHLSHLKALRQAFEDPTVQNVLVFEDDLQTNFTPAQIGVIMKDVATHLPANWDVLYLGTVSYTHLRAHETKANSR